MSLNSYLATIKKAPDVLRAFLWLTIDMTPDGMKFIRRKTMPYSFFFAQYLYAHRCLK